MADVLETTGGDFPIEEVELGIANRTWTIRHVGSVISAEEEAQYLRSAHGTKRPYGAVLWPSAIALAHEIASREIAGKRILELGAGTGFPGIVAASLGAHVVQTDRQRVAMHVCRQNAERNRVTIDHRLADWTQWEDTDRYDVIMGSDILYAEELHGRLRNIFDTNLGAAGTVLIADPFREASLLLLRAMEADGWRVSLDKWTVGVAPPPRPVGVYALTRAAGIGIP
ncbi:MAG: methyltransferase domain-containing protein [Deltaproteobacteria bacterium]|nr:methyltransferase domain-containing protein [Deltaproteobacteria bacterium]